jgi:hypothetical protein
MLDGGHEKLHIINPRWVVKQEKKGILKKPAGGQE